MLNSEQRQTLLRLLGLLLSQCNGRVAPIGLFFVIKRRGRIRANQSQETLFYSSFLFQLYGCLWLRGWQNWLLFLLLPDEGWYLIHRCFFKEWRLLRICQCQRLHWNFLSRFHPTRFHISTSAWFVALILLFSGSLFLLILSLLHYGLKELLIKLLFNPTIPLEKGNVLAHGLAI